jgi:hypothetical protein
VCVLCVCCVCAVCAVCVLCVLCVCVCCVCVHVRLCVRVPCVRACPGGLSEQEYTKAYDRLRESVEDLVHASCTGPTPAAMKSAHSMHLAFAATVHGSAGPAGGSLADAVMAGL